MEKQNRFSINGRLKNFQYAFEGIVHFFRTEVNATIHLIAAVCVTILAVVVEVTNTEIIFLALAIALVWITEMINTCIEKAMDIITEEYNAKIKIIKDISAGAVLIASIAAALIGFLVFIPKFVHV